MDLIEIKYGTRDNYIDVTAICYSRLMKKNIVRIPRGYGPRTSHFTDPASGVQKSLFVLVKSNQTMFEYDESKEIFINMEKLSIITDTIPPYIREIYPIDPNDMSLFDIVDDSSTDKNTTHSYLELYQKLLYRKKESAKLVLEVGIGDFGEKNGGSIKMWRDFFPNAVIYGLDILPFTRVMDELIQDERVFIYASTNAYDESFFENHFLTKKTSFDVLLDDGPHTIESMQQFIKLYSKVMAEDGILIIEDIPSLDWIELLSDVVPLHLKPYIKTYDLRKNKGRYDDIVFTIDKSSSM